MIRNIWAVGRNYSEHAIELGNAVPSEPLFFLKAGSCVVTESSVHLPSWENDIHHEIEIALQFGENLEIAKIGLALDLTARSLQSKLKEKQGPWTLAKSFTNSCPLSTLHPITSEMDLGNLDFCLWVNDEIKQKGNSSSMNFSIPHLVEYAKAHFPVCPGDLLITGTPHGVGPLKSRDQLKAKLGQFLNWEIQIK